MVESLKLDKKSFQYLGMIIIIATVVCIGFFYYCSQVAVEEGKPIRKKRITKDILKQFEAVNLEGKEIPKEILEEFGASNLKGKEIPEEVLKEFGTF